MAWKYPLLDRINAAQDGDLADHPSVERAMGVAWDSADPAGRRRIISTLLQRRRPEGLVVLIERLHEMDPGSRAELARQISSLQKPLRLVLSHGTADGQINALLLIQAAAAGSLAYLAVEKLRSSDEAVQQRAEDCLLGMVERVEVMDTINAQRLTEAINGGVVGYARHRRAAALRAWLGLAPRGLVAGGRAIEALQDAEHPAVMPMRELLQAAEHRFDRAGLVAALAVSTLNLAAVRGLRRCFEHDNWGEAIEGREHLLDWSAVRRGLARGGEPRGLLPETWDGQSEEAIAALPAWMAALPMSPLDRTARLESLLTENAPPAARMAAARHLMALAEQETGYADPRLIHEIEKHLRSRLDDDSLPLARLSAVWLLRQNAEPDRRDALLTLMSRSRHEAIRTLAGRRLSASAFDRLWRIWPQLDDTARLRAARAALKVDPLAVRRLESHLKRGGSHRTRALEIVTCAPEVKAPAGLQTPAVEGAA